MAELALLANVSARVTERRVSDSDELASLRKGGAGDDPHGGGLAGTIGSDETEDLTVFHLEGYVRERFERAEAFL